MKKSEKNEQLKTTFLAAFKPKQIEPTPIPLCSGHKIPAVERAVKDPSSIHIGRCFFTFTLPAGPPENLMSQCKFFQWHPHTPAVNKK